MGLRFLRFRVPKRHVSFTTLLVCLSLLIGSGAAEVSTIVYTVVRPAPTPTADSRSYTSDKQFRSDILNSTNFYRRQHNAKPLVWNDTLADYAARWASYCKWEHSGGPNGENLASNYANATAAVEAWGHEGVDYDFDSGDFTEETGHFTQLVWRDTVSVGCGRRDCGDGDPSEGAASGWYVVCEYWPPGNVLGSFKKEVKEGESAASGMHWIGRGWMTVFIVAAVSVGMAMLQG